LQVDHRYSTLALTLALSHCAWERVTEKEVQDSSCDKPLDTLPPSMLEFQRVLIFQYILNDRQVMSMAKKKQCCEAMAGNCFKVESIISVDDRGQMVLPKEVRDRAKIRPGDKLALVSWEMDGEVCCLALIKTDELSGMVKTMLGPMVKEIATK
jgi:AbrB family looped-hinge helix DNA binding protein